ncbi:hypothetical protein L9F63_002166 [Diploptera punctata]|uniref:Ionotropic receptor n=1 Tax=Diploptera punctata TaxID=6984 RepID=A0AAD8A2L2_DIPPU|nr:hypothetical protein L9F63_002166 [Diploptera punctata]
MKINLIVCILCLHTNLVCSKLINYLFDKHIQTKVRFDELTDNTDLISLCKYHFSSTRILSILFENNHNENWKYFSNKFIRKMSEYLNIPTIVTEMEKSKGGGGGIFPPHIPNKDSEHIRPDYINNYPAESQHSYILLAEDPKYLRSYVVEGRRNSQQQNWNPKDNFLLIIPIMSHLSCNNANDTFDVAKKFWEKSGIINTVTYVKFFYKCGFMKDIVFMYNPFKIESSGDDNEGKRIPINLKHLSHIPKTYLKRTWNLESYSVKISLFNIFPTSVRECMNCNSTSNSIEIPGFDKRNFKKYENCNCSYKGRDWEVLKNLAKYMNFIPSIISEGILPDVSEAIDQLIRSQSEIAFNERYMKDYNSSFIEFTMPAFYTRKIVVIVAKAQNIPIWMVIWKYFSGLFWICFIITFIASTLLWYKLRKYNENVSKLTNTLDMFAVFITMSLSLVTKVVNNSQRLLLTCCLFSSLIIMSYFQSSLLDVVSYPHFYPEINTLSQLDKANIPIFTDDSSLVDTFNELPKVINLKNKVKYELNFSVDALLQEMIIFKNSSFLTSMVEAVWFIGKYQNELHIVQEHPREYFVSYLIPKGSPYATRIHNLLGKMTAAGLVRKWDLDTSYNLNLEASRNKTSVTSENSTTVFCLYNLVFSFIVFGVGISVSVLVFFIELVSWLKNKSNL